MAELAQGSRPSNRVRMHEAIMSLKEVVTSADTLYGELAGLLTAADKTAGSPPAPAPAAPMPSVRELMQEGPDVLHDLANRLLLSPSLPPPRQPIPSNA